MRRLCTLAIPLALLLILGASPPGRCGESPTAGYGLLERHDRRVYDEVSPAVVGITCRTGPTQGFFGTGVTVSADGYILTSTTVVPKGATNIKVFFVGAMEKTAEIVGLDEPTEAALIKVDAAGLKFVPLADSAKIRPGELAYTFGNPFGTISSDDKVSFSRRYISGVYKLTDNGDFQSTYTDVVIETEAAVNPGSDGGPLVDCQGRLLGIISLGYSERRWLGVAVPVHVIAPKFEALKGLKPPEKHLELPQSLARREDSWQRAIALVAPAVVQVIVARDEKVPPRPKNLSYEQMRAEAGRRYKTRPAGPASGVLVSAEGHVLTAHWNLTGKVRRNELKIRLSDGREFPAKVLGFDDNLDLVMLKADAGEAKLPCAELAKGVEPDVGEHLAVIGRSEDVGNVTVNRGLVSARSRGYRGVIQTSAYVNYGNTGGAVVDSAGRLVGVTGQLKPESTWGLNSGIGFVTTADTIRGIYADLAAGKEVKPPPRTFLGVGPGPDKPTVLGATVGRVLNGSAAHEAGVKAGDVVTHIEGVPVESWSGLVRNIVGRRPGDVITLTVLRGGESKELKVTLRAN